MFIDARTVADQDIIFSDVCIIGAGPAGLSMAMELLGSDVSVCLLESGDIDFHPETQSLSDLETVGEFFPIGADTRRRQFGGTANCWPVNLDQKGWGVRYVPLDNIDFEQRDWIPYSGWPFGRDELDPFYQRAQVMCQSGPFLYDVDDWETEGTPRLPIKPDDVVTGMFQFGPRNAFTHEYQESLRHAPNITAYTFANVVELELDESAEDAVQSVTRVRVACLEGKTFWVESKFFVLATGGIESARLLLLSNSTQKEGLGNENDLVGRFFMDHSLVECGTLVPNDPRTFDQSKLYDLRQVDGTHVMGKLTLPESVMRQEELLNICAILFPRPKPRQLKAIAELKDLHYELFRSGNIKLKDLHYEMFRDSNNLPENFWQRLWSVIKGLDYIIPAAYLAATKKQSMLVGLGRGGWSQVDNNHRRFHMFEVVHFVEQEPNPDNRILLTDDRDALGRQRAQLQWHFSDRASRSVKRSQELLAKAFVDAGIGHLHIRREDDGQTPAQDQRPVITGKGLHHHMGTTRMHIDPKQGVVDANCRVHSTSNLFIASSSVFPTGSYANPTLTIVALAIRLTDHLKTLMS